MFSCIMIWLLVSDLTETLKKVHNRQQFLKKVNLPCTTEDNVTYDPDTCNTFNLTDKRLYFSITSKETISGEFLKFLLTSFNLEQ